MGTRYVVACRDCKLDRTWSPDYDAYGVKDRQSHWPFVLGRDVLESLGRVAADMDPYMRFFTQDFAWWTRHAGHDLTVESEYGDDVGECEEWLLNIEGTLGRPGKCGLPFNHQGPCAQRGNS